ncbi:hypothetical protein [Sneathiella glossodoripedis]|uniref:hypothetical protein n=1 Tax=Sneathiella glossodoripedis TaxID=418853 RepID=UPI0011DE506D|nr:hypothetical protein [Sneathiella glossodoripedis]
MPELARSSSNTFLFKGFGYWISEINDDVVSVRKPNGSEFQKFEQLASAFVVVYALFLASFDGEPSARFAEEDVTDQSRFNRPVNRDNFLN